MGIMHDIYDLKQFFLSANSQNPNVLYMPVGKEDGLIVEKGVGTALKPREYFPDGLQGLFVVWDAAEFKVERVSITGDWVSEETGEMYVARLLNHKGDVMAIVKGHWDIIEGYELLKRHGDFGRQEFEKSIVRYLAASSLGIIE